MNFTELTPAELSLDLRCGSGKLLANRRGIIGLSLFSAGVMGAIALYQTGILKKIPEPPVSIFNAQKVIGSAEAYSRMATPDALQGMTSYAITACLAGMGSQTRSKTHPWIPLGMAAKLIFDAALASKLTYKEWTKYRALCFWCLLSTGATLASLRLGIAESKAAIRHLTGDQ